MELNKTALVAAIIFAMLGVIIGAFGAHKLKEIITDTSLLNSFETGVRYQIYHALALGLAAVIYAFYPNSTIQMGIYAFIVGIILFSGSIYLLVMLKSTQDIGLGKLGLITPIGGLFLIVGWLLLLIGIYKK